MPEILSPTQWRLEAVQDVIYVGCEAGPVSIKQAVGLTQGQATSRQLYSLGIHLSKRNSPLWPISTSRASYRRTSMTWRDIQQQNSSLALSWSSRAKDRTSGRSWIWTSIGVFWDRVWMPLAKCFSSDTFMTNFRFRSTEFIFIRTTSQIPQKRQAPHYTMETSSSGFQRHH